MHNSYSFILTRECNTCTTHTHLYCCGLFVCLHRIRVITGVSLTVNVADNASLNGLLLHMGTTVGLHSPLLHVLIELVCVSA